jgi:hypothetical protein
MRKLAVSAVIAALIAAPLVVAGALTPASRLALAPGDFVV